jgi:threonine/homoserine/homoserine lactone efflux protein
MLPLIQGFLIGFAIAAPVGPIGVLCIRRTLADGRLTGFLSGLGAASADMCYGAVAAFGITALRDFLTSQQFWLRLIGGIFLIFLGVRAFLAQPADKASTVQGKRGLFGAYISTLGLTLTNPATIISFTFIFAGLRLGQTGAGYLGAGLLVAGVFLGSAAWWLALSGMVGFFRERFTPAWMRSVNRIAGLMLCSFGVAALALS